jgi:hypothetical protein
VGPPGAAEAPIRPVAEYLEPAPVILPLRYPVRIDGVGIVRELAINGPTLWDIQDWAAEVENKAIDAYNPADDRRLGKTPLDQQGIDLPALLDRFGIQPEGTGPDFWKRAIGRNLSEWDIPREQPPAPLVDKEASEKVAKALELIAKAQEEAERNKPHEPHMEPLFKMPDLPPERIPLPRPAPGFQNTGPMDLPWGKGFAEAGKSAGQSFSRALDEELAKAADTVSGWAAKLKAMLDFTAGPTVAVSPPGRHRGPGWLAKSRLRASHSDAIHVPGE